MIATPQLNRMAQDGTQQYQGCSPVPLNFYHITRANFETKIELS